MKVEKDFGTKSKGKKDEDEKKMGTHFAPYVDCYFFKAAPHREYLARIS